MDIIQTCTIYKESGKLDYLEANSIIQHKTRKVEYLGMHLGKVRGHYNSIMVGLGNSLEVGLV